MLVFIADGAEGHFALDDELPQGLIADGALQGLGIGRGEGARIGVGALEGGDGIGNGRLLSAVFGFGLLTWVAFSFLLIVACEYLDINLPQAKTTIIMLLPENSD